MKILEKCCDCKDQAYKQSPSGEYACCDFCKRLLCYGCWKVLQIMPTYPACCLFCFHLVYA